MIARPCPTLKPNATLSTSFSDNSHSSNSESTTSYSSSNTSWATHAASCLPKGAQPPRLTVNIPQVEQEQQAEHAPKRRFRLLRKSSSGPRGHTRSRSLFSTSHICSAGRTGHINLDNEASFAARRQSAAGPPPSAFHLPRLSRQYGAPTPGSKSGPTNHGRGSMDVHFSDQLQNAKAESSTKPPLKQNKPLPEPPVSKTHCEPLYAEREELTPSMRGHFISAPGMDPSFSDLGHGQATSDSNHQGYAVSEPHFYHMPSRYIVSPSGRLPPYPQSGRMTSLSMSHTPSRKPSWGERLVRSISNPFHWRTSQPPEKHAELELVHTEDEIIHIRPEPSTSGTDPYVMRSLIPFNTASEPGHESGTSSTSPKGGLVSRPASLHLSTTTNKLRKRRRSESHLHLLGLQDEAPSSLATYTSKSMASLKIVGSNARQSSDTKAPSLISSHLDSALGRKAKKRSNSTLGFYTSPIARRPGTPPPPVPPLPAEFAGRDITYTSVTVSEDHHTFGSAEAKSRVGETSSRQGGRKLIKRRQKTLNLTLNLSSTKGQTSEDIDIEVKAIRKNEGPGSITLPPVRSFSPLKLNLLLGDGQSHTFTDASRSRSAPDLENSIMLARRISTNGLARSLIVTGSLIPKENEALSIPQVKSCADIHLESRASWPANEAAPRPQSQSQTELVVLPSRQEPFSYPPTSFRGAEPSSEDRPSFLRSQSNRRWTLAVSETPEDKLVEELDRLRSIGWGLGFQGELFRKYPQSPEHGNADEGTEEGDGEGSGVWAKEEMEEWLVARKALLVCREIVRTENSYRDGLEQLQRGETLGKPPPLLLQYIPALISASNEFSLRLAEDPSAWGVSMAFVGIEDVIESAFVAWSGVVGEFFSSRHRRRRPSKLEKTAPVSPSRTPVSATPVRTPTSPSGYPGNWRISMGAVSQLLTSSYERARYSGVSSGSGHAKTPTVQDLAIQPTQRVMRYVLLYKDLQSSTPISSPARALVERALEGATRIAQRCNRAQDNAQFLL